MDYSPLLSLAIFVWFVLVTFAEILLKGWLKQSDYSLDEMIASVTIGAGFFGFAYFVEFHGLSHLPWMASHPLFVIPLNNAWQILLLFIGIEFCYYWYHRCSHQIRWFWASHSVHHSSRHFTIAAGYRVAWTSGLSGTFLFYLPLVWIGFPPLVILAVLSTSLFYQVLLHTELIPALGFLDKIFNTPANHRVHHGRNRAYHNRNFGNVLIIFDQVFGTYAPEDPAIKSEYGLIKQLNSNHVLVILFHEWWALWRDVAAAKQWRARLDCLVGKPR